MEETDNLNKTTEGMDMSSLDLWKRYVWILKMERGF